METECTKNYDSFQVLGRRTIVADFSGGTFTSVGGVLLLREIEQRTGIPQRFASCFTDHRDKKRVEHSMLSLVSQMVMGIALGYEDLNDHDSLASGVREGAGRGQGGSVKLKLFRSTGKLRSIRNIKTPCSTSIKLRDYPESQLPMRWPP